MKQRIQTLTVFFLGVGLALGGTAVAGGPMGPMGGPGFHHVLRDLDLTPEQRALADELLEAGKADHEAARAEREAAFDTVARELAEAKPDGRALHRLIDDALDRGGDIAHARLDDFLAFHATLSDAQRQTLVEGLEEARVRHAERMEGLRERFQERRGELRGEGGERPPGLRGPRSSE